MRTLLQWDVLQHGANYQQLLHMRITDPQKMAECCECDLLDHIASALIDTILNL